MAPDVVNTVARERVPGLQLASMSFDDLISDLDMSKRQAERFFLYSGQAAEQRQRQVEEEAAAAAAAAAEEAERGRLSGSDANLSVHGGESEELVDGDSDESSDGEVSRSGGSASGSGLGSDDSENSF